MQVAIPCACGTESLGKRESRWVGLVWKFGLLSSSLPCQVGSIHAQENGLVCSGLFQDEGTPPILLLVINTIKHPSNTSGRQAVVKMHLKMQYVVVINQP